MNLGDAINALKSGATAVTRPAWPAGAVMTLIFDLSLTPPRTRTRATHSTGAEFLISPEDRVAEDYVVA